MSTDPKEALLHPVTEVFQFLRDHGLLTVLAEPLPVRLLLRNGNILNLERRSLEHLIAGDRAKLNQERKEASGRKGFIGYRIDPRYVRFSDGARGGGEPTFGIRGRDEEKLADVRRRWNELNMWINDVIKVFNFALAGKVQIPPDLLPERSAKRTDKPDDEELSMIASCYVGLCKTKMGEFPSIEELSRATGVPRASLHRKLRSLGLIEKIRRELLKKTNHAKTRARREFWIGVQRNFEDWSLRNVRRAGANREQLRGDMNDVSSETEEES